jgi:hypothetical protein
MTVWFDDAGHDDRRTRAGSPYRQRLPADGEGGIGPLPDDQRIADRDTATAAGSEVKFVPGPFAASTIQMV